ncbi:MAG: response regulator transcription factor [Cytophagales bacterium]|nr:response regulator transcription factor [Cytophagales bacterium]
MAIKLFLVEDHELIRGGIKSLLQSQSEHYDVIGEFDRPRLAIEAIEGGNIPEIIIMDISLPEMTGLEASSFLKEHHPEIKIIILSMHKDEEYVLECINQDIMGYVVKDSIGDEIKLAIDKVHHGGKYFSKEVIDIALNTHKRRKTRKKELDEINLTKREKEVLTLIADGKTNNGVAEMLFISERTVEAHRANIMKKVGARNTAELIRKSLTKNLI